METLFNGFTLALSPGAFPLSTDSMVLADFVRLRPNVGVLDLGSGCGTLGLLLCAKNESCTVTGIELDPEAHAMALGKRCPQRHRPPSWQYMRRPAAAALGNRPRQLFLLCFQSPLFFRRLCQRRPPPGPAGTDLHAAGRVRRRIEKSTVRRDFFLVHKPERLGELCALGAEFDLIPKVLRLVRHTSGGSVSLLLLQMRKGAKQGLIFQEEALRDPEGHPTADYRRIYHLDEP